MNDTTTMTAVAMTPFAGHVRTLTWGSVAWNGRTPIAGGDTACDDAPEDPHAEFTDWLRRAGALPDDKEAT